MEQTGTVKKFCTTRKYGWITPDIPDDRIKKGRDKHDAFVHMSELKKSGIGVLEEGQRVSFVLQKAEQKEDNGDDRYQATDVRIIDENSSS